MSSSSNSLVGQYDIVLQQGASYAQTFTFYTDAAMTTELDLSGYTFKAQIRSAPGSSTLIEAFTIVDTDLANGAITLTMTDEETALLLPQSAQWDLFATSGAGDVAKYLEGSVEVHGSITVS